MPIKPHFIYTTRNIPRKKHIVPRILSVLEKSAKVRFTPIAKNNPIRKRVFPIAVSAASKKKSTESARKPTPKQMSPIPIF
mmetsp:Transcript_12020/g.16463  ORF Transcript_12020/g.16463 Transcript_12020/m.16463 type:complete len:81 (+) Transcript_12020:153-395(+)